MKSNKLYTEEFAEYLVSRIDIAMKKIEYKNTLKKMLEEKIALDLISK
jgi:hypothetical protein